MAKCASYLEMFQVFEHAVVQFQFWHHQTTSYAEHNALGGFYDGLADMADNILETYIAYEGRVNNDFSFKFTKYNKGAANQYLKFFLDKIDAIQKDITYTDINNMLDEVKALTNKTIYLLTLE